MGTCQDKDITSVPVRENTNGHRARSSTGHAHFQSFPIFCAPNFQPPAFPHSRHVWVPWEVNVNNTDISMALVLTQCTRTVARACP